MSFQSEMSHEDIARARLEVLRHDHRELDAKIMALADMPGTSSLVLQRLKREKLVLKDRIARLEDELTPDIIA